MNTQKLFFPSFLHFYILHISFPVLPPTQQLDVLTFGLINVIMNGISYFTSNTMFLFFIRCGTLKILFCLNLSTTWVRFVKDIR